MPNKSPLNYIFCQGIILMALAVTNSLLLTGENG